MSESVIDLLARRRSVVAKMLGPPGPGADVMAQILTVAARVPDHKKLEPWRFLVFEGAMRTAFGDVLAGIACLENEDGALSADALEIERNRFERAPVVIAVISKINDSKPVPHWEQILSAGAVCQNILIATSALGFSAQWITEWIAYSPRLRPVLGLEDGERIAGFVYIGTAQQIPQERARPNLNEIVSFWQPPTSD